MLQFFEEHKKKIVIALAVLLAVLALFTGGRKLNATFAEDVLGFVVTPFQDLTTGIGSWVEDTISSAQNQADQAETIRNLEAEIERLKAENQRLSLYEEENKTLSELLRTAQRYPQYSSTGAAVIAKDPGNWYDTFVIDKGSSDGLESNMVIIASGGLVGKITETGHGYSKVMSILDSRSSVSAKSLRTGDLGVVKGDITLMDSGLCLMEYIDTEAEILVGDEIVTSHLSEIYPDGIPIGKVTDLQTDINGLTKYAIIEPYADLKHLETILVMDKSTAEEN